MAEVNLKYLSDLKGRVSNILHKKKNNNDNVIDITKKLKENNKKNSKKNKNIHFNQKTIGISIVTVICVILIAFMLFHKNAYEIYVGETSVGFIKEKGLEKQIYETAIAQIESSEGGIKIQTDANCNVTSKFVRASKKDIVTTDYIISQVKNNISYMIEATAMYVNDREVGILKTQAEIDEVTAKIIEEYSFKEEGANIVSNEFVDNVKYEKKFIKKEDTISTDELYQTLTQQIDVPKTYQVKSGDSLWLIASSNGITINELLKANPDLTENSVLKIGQQLNLIAKKPMLSVKTVKQIKKTEIVPYQTEYQKDDSQFKTYSQVIQQGKDGIQEITENVIYINGYEETTELVGEPVIVEQPVESIVVVGTKPLPAKSATGSFRRPISGGSISSYFGPRWGSTHIALDITAPRGTAIYASDGGTVKKAGWSGSYGNLVVINHGNGFETYYAHCSSIDVTVGQKVGKDEKIAAVGSTGNATGNHVHFEVRKDGVAVNPLNYIK